MKKFDISIRVYKLDISALSILIFRNNHELDGKKVKKDKKETKNETKRLLIICERVGN